MHRAAILACRSSEGWRGVEYPKPPIRRMGGDQEPVETVMRGLLTHVLTSQAKEPGGHGARPSLLIADNDALVRSALDAQLRDHFDVLAIAEDATEAIDLAEEHRPDAAVIDAGVTGVQLVKTLTHALKAKGGHPVSASSAKEHR